LEEQEDDSEDGHRDLHLGKMVNKAGWRVEYAGWGGGKAKIVEVVRSFR